MHRLLLLVCFGLGLAISAKAQGAVVEGRVIDGETDEPLPGVNVAVRADDRVVGGAATNADGAFRIEALPAGTFTVRVSAVGYAPRGEQVRLQAGETHTVHFRMQVRAQELNEIVVRGTRGREVPAATVQRLATAELVRQDAATVAEVGGLLPGVHVQTNSRGQTLIYLRNAGERQTAQFFDGALLNVPWDNRVDLGVLPAGMLEGVTVSKGVPAVRYGPNVVGGAVNFQSRTLSQPGTLTQVRGAVGLPGAGRGSVLHAGRRGPFSYTGQVGFATQSDYALPAGADLPHSQLSGETRTNTDRRFANGFVRGVYQLDDGVRLGVTALHVDAEKGVAPESNVDPAEGGVRYWRYPTWRKTMVILSGDAYLGTDRSVRGAVWGSRFEQDIHQYRSVAYDALRETQADRDLTAGARVLYDQPLGPGALTLSANGLTTRHDQTNVLHEAGGATAPDSNTTYRQHLYGVGAEYEVPLTGHLDASLGVGFEGSAIVDTGPWAAEGYPSYHSQAVSLTAGLTYAVTEHLTWRAAAGRKGRFPTMRELFGGALGKFVPNPDLHPVTALLGETGIVWSDERLRGEATLFLSRTHDAIDKQTIQDGPNAGKEQRINLDGSRTWGVEVVAALAPTERLALDGQLTWMRPRGFLDGETQKLDEKPAWLSTVTATCDLPWGLRALVQADYLGGVFARNDQNVFDRLPDAVLLNGRLSYTFNPRALGLASGEVFARVNNLTDELRLLQLGLPGPGREVLAGLKLTL